MATWALSLANRSSRHPEANPVPADSNIVLIAILSGETGVAIRSPAGGPLDRFVRRP